MEPSNQANASFKLPFQDPSLPVDERVHDLINRMTLEEKAGMLFHTIVMMGPDGTIAGRNEDFHIEGVENLVTKKYMTHFNLLGPVHNATETARWYNSVQQLVIQNSRFGIPLTLSTDPRNHYAENVGTGFHAGAFSQWPETLGFAALRDPGLVEEFANIARQEYLAVGLRVALHPQADLATEPRWARISLTFGEDADLAARLVEGYVRGFQGPTLNHRSVSTMTKHFPGGGPQLDGEDPHFEYGKEQVYPGKNFDYHLKPFIKAIEAGCSQIMPYYGMPVGTEWEEVGFGFNKGLISDLLREKLGFRGIVCSDWGLISDATIMGQAMPARAWGCEQLTDIERAEKILDAGCDQFGGEDRPELVVQLVETGRLPESRIDLSVGRLLREKFLLGLFDDPYVNVEQAASVVGNPEFCAKGEDIQRRAYTLLTNATNLLPIKQRAALRVYTEGISRSALEERGLTHVDDLEKAELALLRLSTPFEPRSGGFEAIFHAGSLEFSAQEKARQAKIFASIPTIVDIYLDRAAIIPEIARAAAALMANYGSSDRAFLDVVFGDAKPEGRLPIDLPSSTAAVAASRPDVPYDTESPLFRFGHGLQYGSK